MPPFSEHYKIVMCPKDTDEMTNCVDPDRSDLGVHFCFNLSVPIFRIFTGFYTATISRHCRDLENIIVSVLCVYSASCTTNVE